MAENFETVFARLRTIMLGAAPGMTIAKDQPGSLELRTPALDPKTRQPGWFGTVKIMKTYVAYHLMPLYDRPVLAEHISSGLAKRKQGKTCFNFVRADESLLGELDQLTKACATSAKNNRSSGHVEPSIARRSIYRTQDQDGRHCPMRASGGPRQVVVVSTSSATGKTALAGRRNPALPSQTTLINFRRPCDFSLCCANHGCDRR